MRVAKGYVMPPQDERGPAVFTLAEIENISQVYLNTSPDPPLFFRQYDSL